MLVNAKEFKKCLKDATVFTDKLYIDNYSYVYLWTEDNDLKILSLDGHCAYMAKFRNQDNSQIELPIALSTEDIKQICQVIGNDGLIDFSVSDNIMKVNGKSKIEISIKHDQNILITYKTFAQDNLSEEIDYTIPKKGIAIPMGCFAKIFTLFKKEQSINIRCMASKKAVDENAFNDLGVCFIFEHGNVKIWCMGMRQSEYIPVE